MNRMDFSTITALISCLDLLGCEIKDIMTEEQANKIIELQEKKFSDFNDKQKLVEELKKNLNKRLKTLK